MTEYLKVDNELAKVIYDNSMERPKIEITLKFINVLQKHYNC